MSNPPKTFTSRRFSSVTGLAALVIAISFVATCFAIAALALAAEPVQSAISGAGAASAVASPLVNTGVPGASSAVGAEAPGPVSGLWLGLSMDDRIYLFQAVIFLVQCWLMFIQARIYKRQEVIMRQTLEISAVTQRADVTLLGLRSVGEPWSKDWEMVPVWINHGQTSATVIASWGEVIPWLAQTVQPAAFAGNDRGADMDFKIGAKDQCEMTGLMIAQEYSQGVRDQRMTLILEGRLDYRDIFPGTRTHVARFRYLLACDDNSQPVWRVLAAGAKSERLVGPTGIRIAA